MDRQGERVAHADVPHPARTDRGVDHRQPKRAARLMERAAPHPGRSGGPEDVRCRLDRDAPRSQPAAGRPRARRRRGLLGPRRTCALRGARVVFLHGLRRALPARAHRDPGGPPRANLGGAAGARVEPASVTAPTVMRKGKHAIGAVLALLSLPVLLVLVEAVSFRVANRPNGSFMSSGRKREYVLYRPRSYDRAKPTPLVISLHGAGMWGAAQRPGPMIAFHGTGDAAAPYKGGFSWVAPQRFQGVRAFTASLARRNRCGTTPVDSVVATDVTRLEYTKCAGDAAVVLYTITGGGHTWPGGQPLPEWFVGRTSNSIDASSLMWAFFRAHRLREAQHK